MNPQDLKKAEAELKAKYGNLGGSLGGPRMGGPMGQKPLGMNKFLAQRLNTAKGQQFFDSGDYNMNKSNFNSGSRPIYLPMQNKVIQEDKKDEEAENKENFKKPEM